MLTTIVTAAGHLLILTGLIGLFTGVIALVHPFPQIRIPTRKVAALVAVVSLTVMIVGGALSPVGGGAKSANSAKGRQQQFQPARRPDLQAAGVFTQCA